MKPVALASQAVRDMSRLIVILDFDGTITEVDTTDEILNRFANDEWKIVEDRWEEGKIGSRTCLSMQTALISATPKQIDSLLQKIPIDPGYFLFARTCQDLKIEIFIVSDGYDRAIAKVLGARYPLTGIFSSRLISMGPRYWRLGSPHFSFACKTAASTCKCKIAEATKTSVVLVGDGRSDFCLAERADYVLAKGKLVEYCSKNEIPYFSIRDLSEASIRIREIVTRDVVPIQQESRDPVKR